MPAEAQPRLCTEELRTTLAWIKERFAFLTPEQLLCGDQPGILLTFDDGFANNFTNALPVLEEVHAPAVFFVTTQHVSDPKDWLPATLRQAELARQFWSDISESVESNLWNGMSIEQLRRAAESPLITIGSHTISHPSLIHCDDKTLEQEVCGSKSFLEEQIGKEVDLFAYPTGQYDQRVLQAVADAGYRAAFVEESRSLGPVAFEIPRIGIYESSAGYLGLKLSGFFRRPITSRPVQT